MKTKTNNEARAGLPAGALFCPLGPMADAEAFGNLLVRHGLIDALAIDDAEYYDGFRTSGRVIEAYDEISKHLTARAEEALGKVKAVMEEIQSRQTGALSGGDRERQSAGLFVSDYADAHLYEEGNPRGLCAGCEHYRPADGGDVDDEANEDWCWLKEGKYADGREPECPAWISSQNAIGEARAVAATPPQDQTL